MTVESTEPKRWLPAAFAGLAASLVGIGLARFAYTPLLPALINAGWFNEIDAIYLGAANLAGYLAGALGSKWFATKIPPHRVLQMMMLLAAISFIACMQPFSFTWYFVWRFLAGASGGVLMVMAATTVFPHVPPAKRGLAGGIIFTGVGLGIALSGTLVPALIQQGLAETWAWLGGISLFLTALTWRAWPKTPLVIATAATAETIPARHAFSLPLNSLYIVYSLVAVGLVAHMVFLVDFVARGLNQGISAGATYWIVFGTGALIGPLAAGRLADHIGFRLALRIFIAIQVGAVALAYISSAAISLYASSFLVGAVVPGIVPLIAGRTHALSRNDTTLQRTIWSYVTVAFSIGQAAAAYAFSYVFEITGRYDVLFLAGATAVFIALCVELLTPGQDGLNGKS